MKHDLIDILCCPICKSDLTLSIEKEDKKEIVRGTLQCQKCKVDYPIEEGIPNMLPPNERGQ